MREASLLPSSLRLDLLLSAAGFSFGSSSDWLSVLSQAVLLACVGQAFTNTGQVRYENGCSAAITFGAHAHGCISCTRSRHTCYTYRCLRDL